LRIWLVAIKFWIDLIKLKRITRNKIDVEELIRIFSSIARLCEFETQKYFNKQWSSIEWLNDSPPWFRLGEVYLPLTTSGTLINPLEDIMQTNFEFLQYIFLKARSSLSGWLPVFQKLNWYLNTFPCYFEWFRCPKSKREIVY
jgi:hypothetical protein